MDQHVMTTTELGIDVRHYAEAVRRELHWYRQRPCAAHPARLAKAVSHAFTPP